MIVNLSYDSNVKRARDETRKLETESRKMEERLAELRFAMNKEKEEREYVYHYVYIVYAQGVNVGLLVNITAPVT